MKNLFLTFLIVFGAALSNEAKSAMPEGCRCDARDLTTGRCTACSGSSCLRTCQDKPTTNNKGISNPNPLTHGGFNGGVGVQKNVDLKSKRGF